MAARCHVVEIRSCILLCLLIYLSTSCMVDVIYDKRLNNSTFSVTGKSSIYSCAAECVSYAICKSFNFGLVSRNCYLNTGHQTKAILQNGKNFIYSGRDDWETTPLGPCQSTPCGSSHRCTVKRNKNIVCVEVLVSLVQGKPAMASSALDSKPENAVDGRNDTNWLTSSCFQVTYSDTDAWWQVDLQDPAVIVKVHILGRSGCCVYRLHDFTVEVFKKDPVLDLDAELQLCYMFNDTVREQGVTIRATCTAPMTGRYLRIHRKNKLDHEDILQFCEVTVFGITLINW